MYVIHTPHSVPLQRFNAFNTNLSESLRTCPVYYVILLVVVVVVVVVVLTLTRIIKSVFTGQAPVSGAEECPREKHKQPKVVHAYITADAIHASTRNMKK